MIQRLSTSLVILICFLFVSGCNSSYKASSQLQKIFDDDWEFRLKENPFFATSIGDKRFNDKLPAVSEADCKRRNAQQKIFLERLNTIDTNWLTDEQRVNYDIFRWSKENSIAWHEFRSYLMPITQMGGFHTHFPEMPDRIPLKTVKDYQDYIARLNAFKSYAQGHIELMRIGIEEGFVLPKVVLKDIKDSIEPHIVSEPNQSLLFAPFDKFPKTITQADRQKLTEAGTDAITNSIVPAYKQFLKFVNDEYVPAARKTIAVADLPNGKAYYEHRVNFYTNCDLTPLQVRDVGLAEVKRIRKQMNGIIQELGFEGDFNDFTNFLHNDEQFYAETSEELLKEVALILKKVDGQLPKFFKTLPRMTFGIKQVPEYMAVDAAPAYYARPVGDGIRAGFFYINTYDLKNRPLYTIEAISLHEAAPGHHLQIALQQELQNIPNFRRHSWFPAFGEGWALYAEGLGMEMDGLYKDPYSRFGRFNLEMWRACRLVVDTGIHYFGWSRQQAIDFMTENTVCSPHNIATEIDRYIVWPGQALSYKMGELKIRQLRTAAEQKLGDSFDIRQFHDIVLSDGAVPLPILEKKVNAWIANESAH